MEPILPKITTASGQRRGLGRGLEALLPSQPAVSAPVGDVVQQIEVSRIDPNPYQPRHSFHPERLKELADSIHAHGVVQPIVVRAQGERYVLIAGERRWRAAAMAGFGKVAAIVRDVPDAQVLELTLIENIQREDLNPIETAEAFARLADDAGLTHEQIAERTGKDRVTVTNYLRLLKLPEDVRKRLEKGDLTMGHARALLALPNEAAQKVLATRIVHQGLSVRQTEALAKKLPERTRTHDPVKQIWKQAVEDPNVLAAIEAMARVLGTRVRLVGDDMHGKIVIEYYTSDDLDRIYEMIVGKR